MEIRIDSVTKQNLVGPCTTTKSQKSIRISSMTVHRRRVMSLNVARLVHHINLNHSKGRKQHFLPAPSLSATQKSFCVWWNFCFHFSRRKHHCVSAHNSMLSELLERFHYTSLLIAALLVWSHRDSNWSQSFILSKVVLIQYALDQ